MIQSIPSDRSRVVRSSGGVEDAAEGVAGDGKGATPRRMRRVGVVLTMVATAVRPGGLPPVRRARLSSPTVRRLVRQDVDADGP